MNRNATLTARLQDYMAMRRALGFDLAFSERVLRKFTEYADANGHTHVTTALFLSWKNDYGRASKNTWAARLGLVRLFALWLQTQDDRTDVPPVGLIPRRYVRARPYIYSTQKLKMLVAQAGRLQSPYGLRGVLYETIFGLIATTGLRISEATRLERTDVDLDGGLLNVRRTKNGSERVIPLRPCGVEQLAHYAAARDRLTDTRSSRFFVQENGGPATAEAARYNFAQVSKQVGLRKQQPYFWYGIGPRIHDLRHTFAVHTILDWFHAGHDIDCEMYRLSEPVNDFETLTIAIY